MAIAPTRMADVSSAALLEKRILTHLLFPMYATVYTLDHADATDVPLI